jgi:hypothetical protein
MEVKIEPTTARADFHPVATCLSAGARLEGGHLGGGCAAGSSARRPPHAQYPDRDFHARFLLILPHHHSSIGQEPNHGIRQSTRTFSP